MTPQRVGILHPGEMGISLAASAQNSGREVYWVAEGRSPATQARANRFGLRDAGSLAALGAACDVVVSVCPPHAAEDVAAEVAAVGFRGVYVDANAVSPQRAVAIGRRMAEAGAAFVDGGIIGGPAWKRGSTWLYLAGPGAETVAGCFAVGPLETRVLDGAVGTASALKMCYAAYTKGTTALLCAILATADRLGVREALYRQWDQDEAGFAQGVERRARGVTAKAWRFAGEMEEIAATLDAAGLPPGFHLAAADVYRRLAPFKGAPETPTLEALLAALLDAS